jgi:hypothetical protein
MFAEHCSRSAGNFTGKLPFSKCGLWSGVVEIFLVLRFEDITYCQFA